MKLQQPALYHLKRLDDYELVLSAHQLQINADFLVVSQEAGVQEIFDAFADKYGLSDELRETLESPSLIEDVTGIELRQQQEPVPTTYVVPAAAMP